MYIYIYIHTKMFFNVLKILRIFIVVTIVFFGV